MNDYEKQWITAAIINKDRRFFGYLVKEHQSAVRGYLRRLSKGDFALADDLAQETFLLAYRKISTFKAKGSFKAWLFSIAYRSFLQHIRKNSTNPLMSFPTETLEEAEIEDNSGTDISVKIDLEKAISKLNKNERSVLTLSFSYGMSHSEISDIMSMPLGTVKSHHTRGKTNLKKVLSSTKMVTAC
ncbi:RNA polymerase sigma factor [Pseudemcibacter aquimaris]|uniref:RNA polymerase sigma factor n=1 Tax=Pseudemcibacter aquimaris TaxID=2857064 RepID=UPI00201169BC|nr:RNA polymerase sigma factor [Pseudemcibacter aquimaris]MCC3861459.1 RNA polymerase sigma factor [Pseudemcibacter aquimaris]WDU58228.1 RNA polymerase sigma factor [Pseudemcibacter aquimaris]